MPLPIAHGLLGASIVAAVHPDPARGRYCLPLILGALLANCPDADFLLVRAFHDRSWHRAFTHSLVFALVVSLLMLAYLGRSRVREAVAYGLAFTSHGVLDFVTTKVGGGVKLLWPFSPGRLKLGVFGLSEIPSRMLPSEVFRALLIEFAIFAPLLLATLLVRRRFLRRGELSSGVPSTKGERRFAPSIPTMRCAQTLRTGANGDRVASGSSQVLKSSNTDSESESEGNGSETGNQ